MNAKEGQRTGSEASASFIPILYSIGYGSRTLAEFVSALREQQIDCVIDVPAGNWTSSVPPRLPPGNVTLPTATKNSREPNCS